jgi:hypothetical protein
MRKRGYEIFAKLIIVLLPEQNDGRNAGYFQGNIKSERNRIQKKFAGKFPKVASLLAKCVKIKTAKKTNFMKIFLRNACALAKMVYSRKIVDR